MKRLLANMMLLCMVLSGYAVTISNNYKGVLSDSPSVGGMYSSTPSTSFSAAAIGSQILDEYHTKVNVSQATSASDKMSNLTINGESTIALQLSTLSRKKGMGSSQRALAGNWQSGISVDNGALPVNEDITAIAPLSELEGTFCIRKAPPGGGSSTGELPLSDALLWMVLLVAGYAVWRFRKLHRKA